MKTTQKSSKYYVKLCKTTRKLRKTTQNQELREIETMRNHAQPCETMWNHMKPQKTTWNLEEFILICFTGR